MTDMRCPGSALRCTEPHFFAIEWSNRAGDEHKPSYMVVAARTLERVFLVTRNHHGFVRRHQSPQAPIELRSASEGAGFPPPISPEAGSVLAHQGFRPDDRDGLEDRWKPSIQHDQE
jgi:hypothetical protein